MKDKYGRTIGFSDFERRLYLNEANCYECGATFRIGGDHIMGDTLCAACIAKTEPARPEPMNGGRIVCGFDAVEDEEYCYELPPTREDQYEESAEYIAFMDDCPF